MNALDAHFIVRAASLYLVIALTAAAWAWRRPSPRHIGGAILAFAWNLNAMLLINLVALRCGWWQFDAQGGLFLGIPVDLYLAWAWLWGAVPAIAAPNLPLPLVALAALAVDLVLMPLGAPVFILGRGWLLGEALGLSAALVPSQLFARWTKEDRRLAWRATMQYATFAGLAGFVIPAMAITGSETPWSNPLTWPVWRVSLAVQLLGVPAALGVTAVQEFVTRGAGTPVPFDPPKALVTTGIYAYVRNPMQIAGTCALGLLGLLLWNPYVGLGAVAGQLYAVGFARWDEEEDLRRRFGRDWADYRGHVRRWRPRLRPWHDACREPARLYVAESCEMCREVAAWFEVRGARGLEIVPAESHPTRRLERITYEPADGAEPSSGVAAIARGLEHIHLAWAIAGCLLRLPVVGPGVQLLVDACGGGPRRLADPAATQAS